MIAVRMPALFLPSPVCRELVQSFESCRLTAYQDEHGIWTIGWGHTKNVHSGDTCTQAQADEWLVEDLHWAAAGVEAEIHVPITQGQFDALVSFQFNTGGLSLKECHLRDYLNAGNVGAAAAEFPKWDHIGKKESAGLLRRRNEEMKLFLGQQ